MKKMMTRAEWYSDYMEYRQVYGRKKPANDFVKYFLNWCSREHPETDVLTQSMIDVWCKQRECESNRSFVTRVSAINVFLKYINERSSNQFDLVDNDLDLEPLQEPTLFSKEELANFFRATDEINAHEDCRIPLPRFQAKLKALIVPVIFRLMYSTGLRPNEVRWLDCADVDFENGIIHVRKAKGYYQRIIALHPSMVSMLKRYNELMEKEMPGRKVFFPNTHDEYRDIFFITTQFKRCWYKYNQHGDREVISYSLRHNYAVENIMSWPQDGYNMDQKMLVLSKSMGHQRLSSTLYYFHYEKRRTQSEAIILARLFAEFIEDMDGKRSPYTIMGYKEAMRQFATFAEEEKHLGESDFGLYFFTQSNVYEYVRWLRRRGVSDSTCNMRIGQLTAFLKYLSVNKQLQIYAEKARKISSEVPEHIHSHQFRHSMATHLLEDGMNIYQISKFLGHESVQTTMIYLGFTINMRNSSIKQVESSAASVIKPKWNANIKLKDLF